MDKFVCPCSFAITPLSMAVQRWPEDEMRKTVKILGKGKRIAIKVIDHRGNEVMMVREV